MIDTFFYLVPAGFIAVSATVAAAGHTAERSAAILLGLLGLFVLATIAGPRPERRRTKSEDGANFPAPRPLQPTTNGAHQ